MGLYINPSGQNKEEWLHENATQISRPYPSDSGYIGTAKALVCLVHNPGFTAAGVMVDQRDFDDFTDEDDPRFKRWYLVDKSKLPEVCNEWHKYKDQM